jgi:AhpC/TSA family
MSFRSCYAVLLTVLIGSSSIMFAKPAGGAEYIGQFEKSLAANVEEFERVILKRDAADKWAGLGSFDSSANFSSGRLSNPQTGQFSVFTLIVENGNDVPVIFADINDDRKLTSDEKFPLVQEKKDNPFLWTTTIPVGLKEGFFSSCPIFVRYFKSIQTEKMTTGDRLVTQSTEVMARGSVDVKGRKVIVQYALPAGEKKVNPQQGWLGVDIDGDGAIDMDNLSPEAARADAEAVVFKVGDTYLSTKKADVSKNQIVMREHEAKEYKRFELGMGKLFPEFNFTDFEGKKRKISEFRGKYVLLDIWGFWCGPCRKELPYIRKLTRDFREGIWKS